MSARFHGHEQNSSSPCNTQIKYVVKKKKKEKEEEENRCVLIQYEKCVCVVITLFVSNICIQPLNSFWNMTCNWCISNRTIDCN